MASETAKKDRPFGSYERSLAFRYIRAKREYGGVAIVSVLSLVGIMLAVAALIIVMSIMNGFQSEVIKRMLGNSGHIVLATEQFEQSEVLRLEEELEARPAVDMFVPKVEDAVLASTQYQSRGAYVRGFRPEDALQLPYLKSDLYQGSIEGFGEGRFGGDGILVSRVLARDLGTYAGDKLTLIAPEGPSTVGGVVPRKKTYTVLGVYEIYAGNLNPLDHVSIVMPLEQAQLFFNSRDRIQQVSIKLTDPELVDSEVRRIRDDYLPVHMPARTWKELTPGISNTLDLERDMMRLIFAVLITITALNIITGIVMLVKNKARDVAILRTIGASRSAILRVFLMIGALLGVTGTLLGLAIGVLFCIYIAPIQNAINAIPGVMIWNPEVYGLPHIPAKLDWREAMFASAYAFVMSVIVSLLPAWNAARLDPVEALRSE